ncbi:GMC family oxidoreductase [Arhodomonas aquaeolei]|uniref:GMC family oxidoreductase n=1 Tax=Arhodomonas aquaeolei TaxID=2369 RepID=UPI00037CD669|nr:GMC family oxidoreductase [Arhodomonas aquaeolei]
MSEPRIVIIGSGPGGAAAAWALTRRGIPVLMLEAGPRFDPDTDFRLDRPDWEARRFPHRDGSQGSYRFAPLQQLEARWDDLRSWNRVTGRLNDGPRRRPSGIGYHHVRGVGGSTLHYTGEAHRLNRHSMRMRSRFGVAADWPLDYDTLEPWYREAETLIGIAGPGAGEDRPGSRDHFQPPHPIGSAGRRLARGARVLGLDWVANDRAALSRPHDGRPACNYCGNCNLGCPRRDKGSADVTFIRRAAATGHLRLRTGVQATRLETGADRRITAVHAVSTGGADERIPVERVILAGGAVESPRLLLASASPAWPDGIANGSGQVGRNFMETLFWSSSALAELPIASFKCLPSDSICWNYNRPDAIPDIVGGCRFSVSTNENGFSGPIQYAQRVVGGFGHELKRGVREQLGDIVSVSAVGESLPSNGTFVDLHPQDRDDHGVPLARIHSHLGEGELQRLAFMARTCRRILEAAGTSEPVEEFGAYDHFAATHVFGTCRMGSDPHASVVNAELRSHDHGNLHIVDASVFPSSGGGESPSLTISALALRAGTAIANAIATA